MGRLIGGVWHDQWHDTRNTGGRFIRAESRFRNRITRDGPFRPEPGRYHLYASLAGPWAHRTLIFRVLKGLYEVYLRADPHYSGRVAVPVLWDKLQGTILNNESSEIIRMFNSEFDGIGARSRDYYPADLRGEIDALNERIYQTVNNGVYKAGFATTQQAHEDAVRPLFETSIGWSNAWPGSLSYAASMSPKPTGDCSPPCCGSMRSISVISSAICAGSWIIRISGTIPARCFRSSKCPKPSISPTSSDTTT